MILKNPSGPLFSSLVSQHVRLLLRHKTPSANANAVIINMADDLHWGGRAASPQLARGEDEPMQCCIDGDEICK
jgi:hypothetical protein